MLSGPEHGAGWIFSHRLSLTVGGFSFLLDWAEVIREDKRNIAHTVQLCCPAHVTPPQPKSPRAVGLPACGPANDIFTAPRAPSRALPPPSVMPMSPFPFHPKVPLGEHRRLPEAGLAVPFSTASWQDGSAVPSHPGRPSWRPLALSGASQARPSASLPLRLAAPTPQSGTPPAGPSGAQPHWLQQRLGRLGVLPPAQP